MVGLDLSRAHSARVYGRWLGGKDHWAADREAADQVAQIAPWVLQGARASRAFLSRAARYLAGSGVRNYLDIGVGLPAAGSVHEIARRYVPDARVAHVDNDPMVLAYARALLAGETTIAVPGDVRDPAAVLADPAVRAHLDFEEPVAVLLVSVLHFLANPGDDPAAVVAAFRDALAPGSFIVISHVADLPDDHQSG